MRAKEFLTELGNSIYPYHMTIGGEYGMNFEAIIENGSKLQVGFAFQFENSLMMAFSVDNNFHVTGFGNAFKILSTVMNILKNELPGIIKDDTDYFGFTAHNKEFSRMRLYDRAAPMITKILGPEWRFQGPAPHFAEIMYMWERL